MSRTRTTSGVPGLRPRPRHARSPSATAATPTRVGPRGNGRLIIDVSKLNRVRRRTAAVGAGAKLIDVYRALGRQGRHRSPAGSCPTVGVSGLTLGGGHGVASRAYGLTCDSLTPATLITADGKELTANATENKDLFWALRGAGNGNFGVVTELRFRTHPAPAGRHRRT